ncbi:hypothetical protein QF037_000432 [Streptomyces canus]|uniref:hypothetical protein n=1 Tax=Streptomyces canus TaxID=58343 RepID=UPI002787774B|nr:hypothetical protein [Streptomyces canus]MDQ0596087.1 hypothetical protein [Streptomyces canus]
MAADSDEARGAAMRLVEDTASVTPRTSPPRVASDSCWSLTSDQFRYLFMAGARGDGCWVAIPSVIDPRARPHPLPSFLQSLRLHDGGGYAVGRTFISGGAWPGSPFVDVAERPRRDSDWRVHEIPVGHNIARRDPSGLAAVLGALSPTGGGA